MADDVGITPGAGASVATDEVGGRHFQRVKVAHGADGSATDVSAASPLPVDSELPAAAALSDAMANPTAPAVAAHGMLWDPDAATWIREAGKLEGTVLSAAARTASTVSAVIASPTARGVLLTLNVTAITGSASLAPKVLAYGGAANASGTYIFADAAGAPAAVTTTGRWSYLVYPGVDALDPAALVATHTTWRIGVPLPRRWYVEVVHGSADSVTYSMTYCTLL